MFEPGFEPGGLFHYAAKDQFLPRFGIKHLKPAFFPIEVSDTSPVPLYLVTEICCALRAACPAGEGSVAILRSMLPN